MPTSSRACRAAPRRCASARATVDLPSGRKLTLTNGVFEVPDTHPKPSPARTRFRAEGTADAAAELVSLERLRDASNVVLDPATTKGNFVAQIALDYTLTGALTKDNVNYTIDADITNFSAEKWVRGQKVEAAALKLAANTQGFYTKGDVKIGGLPATVDYRKPAGDADAEVRIQAVLDDAGRARLGLGMAETLVGPVPFKLQGRVAATSDKESRYQVEADLKDSKITELLPGWWKAAGRATRVTFTAIDKPQLMRFDDIVIEGPGTLVKGMIELDQNGDIALASFPSFALSDGDKATLRADRAPGRNAEGDHARRTVRWPRLHQVVDLGAIGRQGQQDRARLRSRRQARDGHRLQCRGAARRRIAHVAPQRPRAPVRHDRQARRPMPRSPAICAPIRAGGRSMYLESNDAGALLRFTDMYSRVDGGQMWIAMDPPTADQQPQEGVINVRDFSIRGESELQRVASNSYNDPRVPHATVRRGRELRADARRIHPRARQARGARRRGVGPGDGRDARRPVRLSARDDVRLRGTFIPAYALNNFLARVPILGTDHRRRPERGHFRHDLRGGRPAGQRHAARDADVGVCAGNFPQDVRVPQRGRPDVGAAVFAADAVVAAREPSG